MTEPFMADAISNEGRGTSLGSTRMGWVAGALLAGALVVMGVLRWPLIAHASEHLDSDLAVDGLALIDLVHGQWRWHFPGTPYMGIPPLLLSLPGAWIVGPTAGALVSGGVLAYGLLAIAVYALAWSVFGRSAALWSLVPLTFTSTGMLWLSGRISGGHLLIAAWWALGLLGLGLLVRRGGYLLALGLGVWCGLGLYIDRMFLFGLFGLGGSILFHGIGPGRWRARFGRTIVLALGLLAGYLPHLEGLRSDPYDAYSDQFTTVLVRDRAGQIDWPRVRELITGHTRILVLECLPRLVAGYHAVSTRDTPVAGLQSEPLPEGLGGMTRTRDRPDWNPLALLVTLGGLFLFAAALAELARNPADSDRPLTPQLSVLTALVMTTVATLMAFVSNQNIYNSDNYRYLILLFVPYALGLGLFFARLVRSGGKARWFGVAIAVGLSLLMAVDTARWYGRFGWLPGVRADRAGQGPDPVLAWLNDHPEIERIFGGYWDVYRLSFLTGKRVVGVPYPDYPNRFPDWSGDWETERPRTLIARSDTRGPFYRDLARREGATTLLERPGLWILDWPVEPVPPATSGKGLTDKN